MTKVFISYAHNDLQRIRQIVRELKRANLDIWMDTRNLQGGDLWTAEIAEAISACNVFLLFMSESSMKSDDVRREVQLAYEKKKKIVILRLEEVKIPRNLQFQLAGIQWTEAGEKNWKLHLKAAIGSESPSQPFGKTRFLLQASGEIGVLLVDDNALARAAWKRVLSKSKQIKVVGETNPKDILSSAKELEAPEIIVGGLSFMEAGLLKEGRIRSFWGVQPKVILLAENKEQVKSAFKQGTDWAATKPFNDQDLINWVRTLGDDAKQLCSEYIDQLSALRIEKTYSEKYRELVSSILQLLFHPDLVNPEFAERLSSASLAGRSVFRNQAKEHEFWIDANKVYQSRYVTVDIYNTVLESEYVALLGKYLSESHGLLGLIVGRKIPFSRLNAMSVSLFENQRKAVLFLDDSHLREMLEYKAGGINPVCLLQDLYQNLIASAGG